MNSATRTDQEMDQFTHSRKNLEPTSMYKRGRSRKPKSSPLDNGMPKKRPPTPIDSLPIELLTEVLYDVIITTGGNRPFLRVCKRWYQVILATPLLWSIIDIHVPKSADSLNTCIEYCRKAIKYSGKCLLDIKLSFRTPRAKELPFTAPSSLREGALIPHTFPLRLQKSLLDKMIGSNGEVMRRWRSFECIWDFDDPLDPLSMVLGLGQFSYPTPSLERLILDSNSFAMHLIPGKKPQFPHLPRIQVLRTPSIDLAIHERSVDTNSLRDVALICRNPETFRLVLASNNLTRLLIGYSGNSPNLENNLLTFPHLEMLCATGKLPVNFWNLLDAPKLESVTLVRFITIPWYTTQRMSRTLPSLKRLALRDLIGALLALQWLISDFVIQAPNLTRLQCDVLSQEVMFRVLKNLDQEGLLSSRLDTMFFEEMFDYDWQGTIFEGGCPTKIRTLLRSL
ncbi:hypothetical protein CPB86DRAFT_468178 [Serendipita vermifera]|nr:hypothetical protein CPB86DRAFT_468178 [Serendipita vermifera]